jgi:hypothetical protein
MKPALVQSDNLRKRSVAPADIADDKDSGKVYNNVQIVQIKPGADK